MTAQLLTVVHIAAGIVSLLAGLVAATTKIVPSLAASAHRVHVRAEQLFTLGMTAVFVTAVPLGIIDNDAFILCVALFSYYLALSGWRAARNRSGTAAPVDWAISATMLAAGISMLVAGLAGWSGNPVTLGVFGALGASLALVDIRSFRVAGAEGANATANQTAAPARFAQRISRHLTLMLAGVIATITAALVVNVTLSPEWLGWLLPLFVITPLIIMMNRRVLKD